MLRRVSACLSVHQFRLRQNLWTRLRCVIPPFGDQFIRWICPTIWRHETFAQAPAARFLSLPPIFHERDASSRRSKARPFGHPASRAALPRRLCLRRDYRRRRREGWRVRLWLKGYPQVPAHASTPKKQQIPCYWLSTYLL